MNTGSNYEGFGNQLRVEVIMEPAVHESDRVSGTNCERM